MEALQFTRRFIDLEIVYIPILYPLISEEELVESFRQEISKYEKVAMCIFDHVSSMVSTFNNLHGVLSDLHHKFILLLWVSSRPLCSRWSNLLRWQRLKTLWW